MHTSTPAGSVPQDGPERADDSDCPDPPVVCPGFGLDRCSAIICCALVCNATLCCSRLAKVVALLYGTANNSSPGHRCPPNGDPIRKLRTPHGPWEVNVGLSCTHSSLGSCWVALRVQRYLSNTASFVLCASRRAEDHHKLLHYSPLLKNTCVRRVVLDKWFPLVVDRLSVSRLRRPSSWRRPLFLGAKDCTPEINTSETIVDSQWHFTMDFQWCFPTYF